nr:unnamed protein product [Callosobruchus analis]
MKCFPREPYRRKQWQIETRRQLLSSYQLVVLKSYFAADKWKKTRVDGTRALKWNPEPTIFSFSEIKISRKIEGATSKRFFDGEHID